MENFKRFAIYYCPEPGPFADFMARWLGWDADAGQACPHPQVSGLPLSVDDLTATPRKYGFHGTLKPPFRIAERGGRAALEADLAELARRLTPVELPGLALQRLGGFVALVPEGNTSRLPVLAAEVVTALDIHRVPMTPGELTRRRAANLSAAQDAHLTRWGYPYVMDEFRFHLTLTGKLPRDQTNQVCTALNPVLAPLLPQPFRLTELCLCGEDDAGRFHLLHRYALTG